MIYWDSLTIIHVLSQMELSMRFIIALLIVSTQDPSITTLASQFHLCLNFKIGGLLNAVFCSFLSKFRNRWTFKCGILLVILSRLWLVT